MTEHKIVWSSAEGRYLLVEPEAMTLHVLKLEPGAPAPTLPLSPELVQQLRPIDWGSAPRIVGVTALEKFVESVVDAAWPRISEVALIFINAPNNWPARTSFHAQAAARGTSFSPINQDLSNSPLDALGVGGWVTQRLNAEIRANGKFASIEDVGKRVREASRDGIRRHIIQVITNELTAAPRAAMFFGRKDGKVRFRDRPGATPAAVEPDPEDDRDPRLRGRPGLR